jgi:hypothetical protein
MRLNRAQIRNFRSLRDVTVSFEPRCRVLVGINESGKSNVLKALALLDPDREILADDIRDASPTEDPDDPADVRFIFDLDSDDRKAILKLLRSRCVNKSRAFPLLDFQGRPRTLSDFVDSIKQAVYIVDLRSHSRRLTTWSIDERWSVDKVGWLAPAPSVPLAVVVEGLDEAMPLGNAAAVHESSVAGVDAKYLRPLTMNILFQATISCIKEQCSPSMPSCLYWTYSESNILPGQIPIESFATDPASCEPLRQMFALAGVAEIGEAIEKAKEKSNGLRNLLDRIAKVTTKHMRAVWPDYSGVTIELSPNGNHIDASVKDHHNHFNLERRSDGFKRFVTFLLLVSARVKTDQLFDTLYLHDEPDVSLHPSGARYLLSELVRMSAANYVVFSTHSIFMIDREHIERHLIVTKRHEVTSLTVADASNITDEEVLYNALGFSLFEVLQEINIVFEGWRDKRLFSVAMKANTSRAKSLARVFKVVGCCHVKGVKDVQRVTPLLELARRRWIVVSDGDQAAIQYQRDYSGDGPWKRYDELLGDRSIVTAEDLIKPDAFKHPLEEIRTRHAGLIEFAIDEIGKRSATIELISRWLSAGNLSKDEIRSELEFVKEEVFSRLKPSQVQDRYFDFCEKLAETMKALK